MDSRWVVVRKFDEDNTLTHLLWMTPGQVENWIQYSDCILHDVTHKTNRYEMALALFVGFDSNRKNILLAQALLCDESVGSHKWTFTEIIKATNVYPAVILTDADPAVDAAVHQVFTMTYPIHCAYYLTQNLYKNLKKLLDDAYQNFLKDFYICCNSFSEIFFHQQFNKLT